MPYSGEFHFTALRTLGTFRTMSASRRLPRSRFQPGIPAMYACTGASPSAFAMRGLPPVLGALVVLLLIRPEARLLHAQVGPRARRGESPSDDTLETIGRPRVRQRFVRLDGQDPTVDSAPVCAKIETVVHDRLEIVLHQPLLDQVWLGKRAPDLFRRKGYLPFDNDGERFGRSIAHWSILLSRSSRWSKRLCQKPAI